MAGGGQALHAGQGRDMVDDYLDFTEGNAEALSTDPSRIFVLARLEHDQSAVHQHCNKAVVNGESIVRQALARVHRLQGSSVSPLHKALRCPPIICRLLAHCASALQSWSLY